MTLKKAAQITARIGDKTLVDTIVAMEFAASFIPFKKLNTRAKTIAAITNKDIPAGLSRFQNNGFKYIRNILNPVGSPFHSFEDLFLLYKFNGILFFFKDF